MAERIGMFTYQDLKHSVRPRNPKSPEPTPRCGISVLYGKTSYMATTSCRHSFVLQLWKAVAALAAEKFKVISLPESLSLVKYFACCGVFIVRRIRRNAQHK